MSKPETKEGLSPRPLMRILGDFGNSQILNASLEYDFFTHIHNGLHTSEEIARAADNENWRRLTGHVRNTARGLARQGRIVITRHGKPADPEKFKGVYRLRLPMEGDNVAPPQAVDE